MSTDRAGQKTASQGKKKRRYWRWLGLVALLAVAAAGTCFWWLLPGVHQVAQDVELPSRFAGDLIYVEPETPAGARLSLLTDSGGGLYVTERAVERSGMQPISIFGSKRARFPAFRTTAWIPEVTGAEKWMPLADRAGDGMLGQRWFAGGVWTLDYPAQKLILRRQPFPPPDSKTVGVMPLGFMHRFGIRMGNHPRMTIRVDGQPIESLLDTGATVWLSRAAMQVVGGSGEPERGTSFISKSLFDRWHQAHPEWRTVEKGCEKTHEDLIEVPELEVAGLRSGPTWFTCRADGNFTWMSSFMDAPISASIGGNVFRNFRLTIDYPNAVAYLER